MARSVRKLMHGVQGRTRVNINFDPISQASAVIITAAQFKQTPGPSLVIDGRPHLGAANVWVTNIGPHNPEPGVGGVEFHVHTDSASPIDVMVTVTVLENVESFTTM